MQFKEDVFHLSATDLAGHLGCRHLTYLERLRARDLAKPPRFQSTRAEVLREKGMEHERAYLEHLRSSGLSVVEPQGSSGDDASLEAMRSGAEVIYQAWIQRGRWVGRTDVLLKKDGASDLGDWHYEVVDTKLAAETKAGTLLQLCLYSDIVGGMQGRLPELTHVVSPGNGYEPQSFRTNDYLAYYRLVQKNLGDFVDGPEEPGTYPEPVSHCDICRWWARCNDQRHSDDHLSLVAGITRRQRLELEEQGVETLESFAQLPLPLPRPKRGSREALTRSREQARIQLEGRQQDRPVYELLPPEPELGLSRLPTPSPGDIFFDIEGDAFAAEGGLEYLFGWVLEDQSDAQYTGIWATDRVAEQAIFEQFVDFVTDRWRQYPDLHIYHYAPYEPSALKRLMGRYASRENEIDEMLRAGLFVDLYAVVREGLRASVERYSIKDLERFYDYERDVELRQASKDKHEFEQLLALGRIDQASAEIRDSVEIYNRDDCISTLRLRDWLEDLRDEGVSRGMPISRPSRPANETPDEDVPDPVRALQEALRAGISPDPEERSVEDQARWLLAHLLEWHRREAKVGWWEYFRLADLSNEDLLPEKGALSGLQFVKRVGGRDKNPIHRYRFPQQDTDIRARDEVHRGSGELDKMGTVESIDLANRTVDIKKPQKTAEEQPTAIFRHSVVRTGVLEEALQRLASVVIDTGFGPGPARAARDLLLGCRPRLSTGLAAEARSGEELLETAKRLAVELSGGVLPIQGPPGSGKTYSGARMIVELVRRGKKVGITAVSHKVIRNLLDAVVKAAGEEGENLVCAQKVPKKSDGGGPVKELSDNAKLLEALNGGEAQVAAGTAWVWAREEFAEAVDVLVVDEAGQMSLANVLAVSQAATNLILLGDPQQLEQPQKGSHPDNSDISALEHLLSGAKTLSSGRGLFLEKTWRLHPSICELTSELFYESRLLPRQELARQALNGSGDSPPRVGLWVLPVEHTGNQSSSPEEISAIRDLIDQWLKATPSWTDRDDHELPLGLEDILVVAPYNAQVARLQAALPPGTRIGTVDRFQGQEAPIVIVSMTSSDAAEAPRGLEFLYSLNRLNVATSRARCACVLVASPALFEPECSSPRQMQLANALCRYREMASTLTLPSSAS